MVDYSIRESRNTRAVLEQDGDGDASDSDRSTGGGSAVKMMEKRIWIGTSARRLAYRKDDRYYYQWRVYLRDEHDEDLSQYIRKVIFRMHPACERPIAIKNRPPFETTNYSNIEFQISITILFNDMRHSCTIHHHELKLRNVSSDGSEPTASSSKSPVVNERLETIQFIAPTKEMMSCLRREPKNFKNPRVEELKGECAGYSPRYDAEMIRRLMGLEDDIWPTMTPPHLKTKEAKKKDGLSKKKMNK